MIRLAGRALRLARVFIATFVAIQFFVLSEASAQDLDNAPVIFDVRRSLPLEPDEPVFHDFYINAGPESGLKKGMYVTVVRQLSVHNPIQNKQQATLSVTVGKLQVLQVERGITVARLNSELPDEERPVLEFEAIMIGDKVDLASSTTVAPKVPAKKKTRGSASAETTAEAAAANVAVNESAAAVIPAQVSSETSEEPSEPAENSGQAAAVEVASAAPAVALAQPLAKAAAARAASAVASVVTSSGSPENASPALGRTGMVRIPVPGPANIGSRDGASSPQKQPQAL